MDFLEEIDMAIVGRLSTEKTTASEFNFLTQLHLRINRQIEVNKISSNVPVSRQVCAVMNCGKELCKSSRIYCQEHEDDIY